MAIRSEFTLRLPNSPGALAAVCRLLAAERVHLTAFALESGGQLRLVVDNPVRAASVLKAHRYASVERPVIVSMLGTDHLAAASLLQLIADTGVNVEYAYGGDGEGHHERTMVVGVADALRAASAAGI